MELAHTLYVPLDEEVPADGYSRSFHHINSVVCGNLGIDVTEYDEATISFKKQIYFLQIVVN